MSSLKAPPPQRIAIRARLDIRCEECSLPIYRCELEGSQMLRLCKSPSYRQTDPRITTTLTIVSSLYASYI
jgi:hypothetical protein